VDDAEWLERRRGAERVNAPVSIYEVHLGSWRLKPLEGNRSLSYLELADELSAYARDMGFTHIELTPLMAHPFSGSWGYQVTGYFAPTPRYGSPDDFRHFVDRLHHNGVGVILDWGTLVFSYGRNEVRNFLLANALYWPREYHADGIRVDAVASMLYLDYSREEGQWVPNEYGGNEDLDAVSFLKEYNEVVHRREPGVISAAEECILESIEPLPCTTSSCDSGRMKFSVRQEAAVHGQRARAGAGVVGGALARLAPAGEPRALGHPVAGARPQHTAFWWLEPNDAENSVFAFARIGNDASKPVVFVAILTPVPRHGYRLGLPVPGRWTELVNTDSLLYGGSDIGNLGDVETEDVPWMNQYHSAELSLPPLAALWLTPEDG
jgi:1,4-alpha-glucan branching enzyme